MYGIPKELTIETILKKVSEWDLWRYYLPGAKLGGSFNSPLRKDSTPSASLFVARNGSILLKDFKIGTFNIWQYLQAVYSLTFVESLLTVNNDFNLGLVSKPTFSRPTMEIFGIVTNEKAEAKEVASIKIKKRAWSDIDRKYWGSIGLSTTFLDSRKVVPLDNYWINDVLLYWNNKYNPAYSYEFGNSIRKIYSPLASKYKFLTNAGEHIIQGEEFLQPSDTLIITKSYKDVLVLASLGYEAVAPQSESTSISDEFITNAKQKYQNIYLLYDNDETGIKYSDKVCTEYSLIPIFVPQPVKDISDYRQLHGEDLTRKLLKTMLYEDCKREEVTESNPF